MNGIVSLFIFTLLAVFAQNTLLIGSSTISSVLVSVKRPSRLMAVSCFISLFTLLSAVTMLPFDRYLPLWAVSSSLPVRAAAVCAAVLVWYLIVSRIVSSIPKLRDSVGDCVAAGAFNGAAIGAALLLFVGVISDFWSILEYSIGTGLGFALASWLLNAGMRRADNPDIPSAFRGAPVMLIYIGLIALAFSAFM